MKLYSRSSSQIKVSQYGDPLAQHLTKSLIKHLDGVGTILEVGCGAGRTLLAVGKLGIPATGLDPEPKAIKLAEQEAKRLNLDHLLKFMAADYHFFAKSHRRQYDTVICSEVAEHIESPDQLIATMYQLLAPGGKLIFTTPHDMAQWSILDEFGHHLRRFSQQDLVNLLSGFQIKKIYTVGFPFHRLTIWVYTHTRRLFGLHHGDHLSGYFFSRIYAPVTLWLLRFDDWFNHLKMGTTWIVVAQKPKLCINWKSGV